jgi:hypothetical protein
MKSSRSDSLLLLVLGCTFFVLTGMVWARLSARGLMDFRPAYFAARCLLDHRDPYNPAEMLRTYQEAGQARPTETANDRLLETRNEYLPSELPFTAPLGLLPFVTAEALWVTLIGTAFALAAILVWRAASPSAPLLAGALLCLLLVDSASLMAFGNPSAIAVSLCVIAAWCFVEERWAAVGVLCMAAALCIKPHTVGFVWLYFVLVGGVYRKRALQTLAVAIFAGLVGVAWVSAVAPHWITELQANLLAFTGRGGMNDPGPSTSGGRGINMITDLQAVFSFFRNDPRFYNLASWVICVPLFVVWVIAAVRSHASRRNHWLGLAAIAPLTMLPLYHRQYDAKLILLCLPACAMLASEGGRVGRWAIGITSATLVLNGDWTWAVLDAVLPRYHLSNIAPHINLMAFPVPLSLLTLASFYLWVFAASASRRAAGVSKPVPAAV